jgi:hypothetical protein
MMKAIDDVTLLNSVLDTHDIYSDLKYALENESARHRNVILGCKTEAWNVRADYCSVVPKLLIQRYDLLKSNVHLSKSERGQLNFINSHNQELSRIVCP